VLARVVTVDSFGRGTGQKLALLLVGGIGVRRV